MEVVLLALVLIGALGLINILMALTKRRRGQVPEVFQEYMDLQEPLTALADAMQWPREWIVCPSCAAHSWRMPPHGFESCPILSEMAQSAGLKLDAERTTAVRTGVMMEQQAEALQEFIHRLTGDDEE